MTYLVAASIKDDLPAVRRDAPALWRLVRRYNLPVQLALAAAEEAARQAEDASAAAVFSLAPCRPGSAELYAWGQVVCEGMARGRLGDTRMNPTQTLHAVDNLAMSAFSIARANRAYCLGLGGAAGQVWAALETLHEQLARGREREALLMAGDQTSSDQDARGLGVALLFSATPRPYEVRAGRAGTGETNAGGGAGGGRAFDESRAPDGRRVRFVRLAGVERRREPHGRVVPHASAGLRAMLTALESLSPGSRDGERFAYDVPREDSDGVDALRVTWEVSA